jgi:hypothetical protein
MQICEKMTVMCKNCSILSYISNPGKNKTVLDLFDICLYCKFGQYMTVVSKNCSFICYIQIWVDLGFKLTGESLD